MDLMVLYVDELPPSTMYVASVHGAPHRQGASTVPRPLSAARGEMAAHDTQAGGGGHSSCSQSHVARSAAITHRRSVRLSGGVVPRARRLPPRVRHRRHE